MSESMEYNLTEIARRTVRDVEAECSLEMVIYQPIKDPESKQGDWLCRIDFLQDGVPLPNGAAGHGVDSFQALINGIEAVRHSLKDKARNLVWLGEPGQIGLPLIIQEDDQDFVALVENVVEAEHRRQIIFRKALLRAKDAKR